MMTVSAADAVTFSFRGGAQLYTVPADVSSISIDAFGTQGGGGDRLAGPYDGGPGGEATATFSVIPGESPQVMIGETGGNPTGGFNGGGAAGLGRAGNGLGGGGATDVRSGACAATLSCGLDARILVAGGGGGSATAAGGHSVTSPGGSEVVSSAVPAR